MAFQAPTIQSMYQNKQLTSPITQIVLLLIVLILSSLFLVKPKLSGVVTKHKELTTAKAQLAAVDQEKRELNRLVAQLQSSSNEASIIDEALPLSGRISKPHILLESLAKSSGMAVVQISPEDTDDIVSAGNKEVTSDPYKPNRTLYTANFSVSVTGTIEQFKNYLELLETNGRILDVASLEILGDEAVTKFRVKIKTYAYEAL